MSVCCSFFVYFYVNRALRFPKPNKLDTRVEFEQKTGQFMQIEFGPTQLDGRVDDSSLWNIKWTGLIITKVNSGFDVRWQILENCFLKKNPKVIKQSFVRQKLQHLNFQKI